MITTIDYRLPEHRQSGFDWFYRAMCATNDAAPELACDRHLADAEGYDFEKRCVLALHHASTNSGSCEAIFAQSFPEMTEDTRQIAEFFSSNARRLEFSSDARYRKLFFPQFLKSVGISIKRFGTLGKLVQSCVQTVPRDNYQKLQNLVFDNWHQCGRMFLWCFAEALHRIADVPLEPPNMEFGNSGKSHTAGWAFCIGRDDLVERAWKKSDVALLEASAAAYIERFNSTFPNLTQANFFTLETACCNYKRGHRGSRYQICYADEQYDDIIQMMRNWPEFQKLGERYLSARQHVIPDSLLYENHRDDQVNESLKAYLPSWDSALRDHGRIPRVEAYFNSQPQRWSEPYAQTNRHDDAGKRRRSPVFA